MAPVSVLYFQDGKKREELLKPTNPVAQKMTLNANAQYKVSTTPTAKIKPKPRRSLPVGRVSILHMFLIPRRLL